MALTNCPDCNREISNIAKACPSCGHPIAAVTIEATGKEYKRYLLIGTLLIMLSIILLFINVPAGIGSFVLGSFFIIYSKSGAWWHHG